MIKDRLPELQEHHEKYDNGETIYIGGHFAVVDMEAPVFDPFFNQIDTLGNDLCKLNQLIEEITRLQDLMLTSPLAVGIKQKLDGKMSEIKLLGQNIRAKLNQLEQSPRGQSLVQNRIVDSQIGMLTKQFCLSMNKYYQSVITFREKSKAQMKRQLEIVKIEKTDEEIEELLQKESFIMIPKIKFETEQSKEKLDQMTYRHEQLMKLEESIREIHEIFFDMYCLVDCQGLLVDDIAGRTEVAEEELKRTIPIIPAIKVSKQLRLKTVLLLIIIIIFGLLLIIYIISKVFTF